MPTSHFTAPVMVTQEGAFVPYASEHQQITRQWSSHSATIVGEPLGLLLPGCRRTDVLMPQPQLAVRLGIEDIAALTSAPATRTAAATMFGPRPQDKVNNQDFALAAAIATPHGKDYQLIVIADGVSTRTFWPDRSARLAALCSLRVVGEHLRTGLEFADDEIADLRNRLTEALHNILAADKAHLLRSKAVPADWKLDTFERNKKRNELWYNSTLLIACAGPQSALLLWAGDGGIAIGKRVNNEPTVWSRPLSSTSDMTVENVVSLAGRLHLKAGRVAMEGLEEALIVLTSDGPDRARQRAEHPDDGYIVAFGDEGLAVRLKALVELPGAEVDNYSAAVLHWVPHFTIDASTRRSSYSRARLLCSLEAKKGSR